MHKGIIQFLEKLQAEGFSVGIDTHLRLVAILQYAGENDLLEDTQLQNLLCPILAENELEQEKFADLFEQYKHLLIAVEARDLPIKESLTSEKEIVEEEEEEPSKKKYRNLAILLSLLVLLVGSFSGIYITESQRSVSEANYSGIEHQLDSLKEIYNREQQEICKSQAEEEALDQYNAEIDSLSLDQNPDQNQNPDSENGNSLEEITKYRPDFEDAPLPQLPELKLAKGSFSYWICQYQNLLRWILCVLLLILVGTFLIWRRKHDDYVVRRKVGNEAPYTIPISLEEAVGLEYTGDFFNMATRLRGRELSGQQRLNIPQTIEATIKGGGAIDFQFDLERRPSEYLILIDLESERSHHAALFNHVYQAMVAQEVYVERYYFDGLPELCWNEAHPEGLDLEQLAHLHPNTRLLIFADGHNFIDFVSGQLNNQLQRLAAWDRRALLTPSPTADWSYDETILSDFFVVLPVDIGGLLEVTEHFEKTKQSELAQWKYEWGKDNKSINFEDIEYELELAGGITEEIEEQFEEILDESFNQAQKEWLAACAVYPELHWDLTLKIGATLSDEESKLTTYHNIIQLSKIAWFQQGLIPEYFRRMLLKLLPEEKETKTRAIICDLLVANLPKYKGSYAWEAAKMHLAMNQLLLSKTQAEKQEQLEEYRSKTAKGIQEDVVTLERLDKGYQPSGLGLMVPNAFRSFFFRKGRSVLGFRKRVILLALGLGLLLIGLWPSHEHIEMEGFRIGSKVYQLSSRMDTAVAHTRKALYHIENINANDVFAAQRAAEELDDMQAHGCEACKVCINNLFYNKGLQAYRRGSLTETRQHFNHVEDSLLSPTSKLDMLHIQGLSRFYLEDKEVAKEYLEAKERELLSLTNKKGTETENLKLEDYFKKNAPNLYHFLEYDFVAAPQNGMIRIRKSDKYGFLDSLGQLVVKPRFERAEDFDEEGLAIVQGRGKECYINKTGVCEKAFMTLYRFEKAGKVGYKNKKGTVIIQAIYEQGEEFKKDLALVKKDGKWGIINKEKIINKKPIVQVNFAYDRLERTGMVGYIRAKNNQRWGLINTKGDTILDLKNIAIGNPSEGLVWLQENREDNYGYKALQKGLQDLPFVYQLASNFRDGKAQVRIDGRTSYINYQGECVRGCQEQVIGKIFYKGKKRISAKGVKVSIDGKSTTTNKNGEFELKIKGEAATYTAEIELGDCFNEKVVLEANKENIITVDHYFKDNRDGQCYKIITIGTKTWFAENLNYKMDGSECYQNNESFCNKYGALYSWKSARKACPKGWYLPTDKDWKLLEQQLGMSGQYTKELGNRPAGSVGRKLKSTEGWDGRNGNNFSGFNALPAGWCVANSAGQGTFVDLGTAARFWTVDSRENAKGISRTIKSSDDGIDREETKGTYLMSCRCMKK